VGTTLNEQLVLTEQNLRFALIALGADVQDVMRMNVFVKSSQQNQDLPVLEPFLLRMGSPVDAVLGVTSLALEGLLVEVQMTVAVEQATVERIRCSRTGWKPPPRQGLHGGAALLAPATRASCEPAP
jgi:hypothetical protein